jgi:hypothetical protein
MEIIRFYFSAQQYVLGTPAVPADLKVTLRERNPMQCSLEGCSLAAMLWHYNLIFIQRKALFLDSLFPEQRRF